MLTNFLLTATTALLAILALLIAYYQWSFQYWKRRNVPHLEPSFPLGNYTNNVFNIKIHLGEILARTFEIMKSRGHRYCGLYLLNRPSFVPIDPQIIRLIMAKDFNHFHNRNLYYNEKHDPISAHLLSVNGEKWQFMRHKVTPIFTSAKIKMMFKIFTECGARLVKVLEKISESGKEVEIKTVFADYSTDVIGTVAFGLELDKISSTKSDFRKYGKKALDFGNWRCAVMFFCSLFPKLGHLLRCRQVDKESGDFFLKTVKDNVEFRERTGVVRNDFLQLLINMKHNKSLTGKSFAEERNFTMEELGAQCFIFLIAGYETSATTMSFALFEISRNKDIAAKIQEEMQEVLARHDGEICYESITEMKYLHQVIEETLRMYPPAYFVTRICTEDYKLPDTDVIIEKGTQIMISLVALHRDPEHFPNPDKFDPERFSEENKKNMKQFTYMPFGEGPRNCIGMRFGLLETKVALTILLTKFKFHVDPRMTYPLKMNPTALLLETESGIWLRPERI